jgi:hypothetical protein
MPWLTKSRFTSGLQCKKRLWNEVHAPLESAAADSVAYINGREVDRLVQSLQPGVVISRDKGMPAAIAETSRVLREANPAVLYQPAFRAGEFAVIADVLRRSGQHATLHRSEVLDRRQAGAHLRRGLSDAGPAKREGAGGSRDAGPCGRSIRAATRGRLQRPDRRAGCNERG